MNWWPHRTKIKIALFVLAFSLIFVRAAFISMNDPHDGRSSIRGDAFSDINTYGAVKYFHEYGFLESSFRPMYGYVDASRKSEAHAYTHYPSLPDILVGAWATVINSTNELSLRLFPILISIFFFFFIFKFLDRWLKNPPAAFISAGLMVVSNVFVAWSDSLHKHTFEEVLKWIYIHLLLLYFHEKKSWRLVAALSFLSLVIVNISFEPALFLSVAVVGFSVAYEKSYRKILNPLNFTLGFFFIAGFALHLTLNASYFGSWDAAKADMLEAFLYRTNQCTDSSLCGLTWKDYLEFPLIILNRIERFYVIPGFAMIVLSVLALRRWKKENPQQIKIFWVLFAASISWYLAMNQHASAHAFVGKQSALLWAWVAGLGLIEYYHWLKQSFTRPQAFGIKAFHCILILYIVAMALTQQALSLYWTYGFSRIFLL